MPDFKAVENEFHEDHRRFHLLDDKIHSRLLEMHVSGAPEWDPRYGIIDSDVSEFERMHARKFAGGLVAEGRGIDGGPLWGCLHCKKPIKWLHTAHGLGLLDD